MERRWFQAGVLGLLLVATGCGNREAAPEAGGAGVAGGAKEDPFEEGRTAFRKCATCHCATDPAVAEDEDWLKMNETTACISAGESTPHVRSALNAYLRSEQANRPVRIDEAYVAKGELPHGKLSLPEVAGSAFLKAEGNQVARGAPAKIRLHWKAGAPGRTLNVPAGTYRVISYALYGRNADAALRWMMTATDINGCLDVEVAAGKTVPLDLQPVFRGEVSAEEGDVGTTIFFKQTDLRGNVATLSANGEVRLPDYVVLDASGKGVHDAVFENT